jgi:anti-anti-sigma factor
MSAIVLVFSGEYDLSTKDEFRAELEAVRDEPTFILDLSAVRFIDSSCVSELLRLQSYRAKKNFGPLPVVENGVSVKRMFKILHLDAIFQLVETLDDVAPKNGEKNRGQVRLQWWPVNERVVINKAAL